MTGLIAALKAKALYLLVGAGAASLVALLSKVVPQMVGKYASRYLEKALDVKNPADREVVLALVKWAEHKIPDRGLGKDKYDLVATKLVQMFPVMKKYQDRISRLIEESVAKMDEELKKKSNA